jgi:hypothetical protein
MIALQLGAVAVEIHDGWTVTRFSDGQEVHALHREQPGQADLAARLGYGTAAAMNREHDLAHSILAHALGLPHSHTLHDVAHGRPASDLHAIEEEAVLALQRFARAAGVDLVAVATEQSAKE